MGPDATRRMAAFLKQAGSDTNRRLALLNAAVSLIKAANDKQLEARLTKTAGLGNLLPRIAGGAARTGPSWGSLGRGLKRLTSNTVARPFTKRMPGEGFMGGARQFAPGRTAGIAGGTGLALGGMHAHEAAKDTAGIDALNPFTYGRGSIGRALGADQGPSEEDIFRRNQQGYDRASAAHLQRMNDAVGTPEYDKLNDQFQRGEFSEEVGWDDPGRWRFGGLNPFAPASSGKYYQQRMLAQQKGLQGKYDAMMGKVGPQPGDSEAIAKLTEQLQTGDLLPQQAQALQRHLDVLKKRMGETPGVESPEAKAIRERMEAAGMRFRGGPKAPAPGYGTGVPRPLMGGMKRPAAGGYGQGQAMMPYDYRPMDQWASVFNNG